MKTTNCVVLGIYPTRARAEATIEALEKNGVRHTDVSILFLNRDETRDISHNPGTQGSEVAAEGAGAGAVIGGTLGLLTGIGALTIPGAGPFIAAGPVVAALAGTTVGGTVGVISGALVGLGIREHEAKRYEDHVKDGGFLLSVHCDSANWAERVANILEWTGGRDIYRAADNLNDFTEAESDQNISRPGVHS